MLVEESLLGWKEYELEVIRDAADNFIVICSIENIDPMGVHTGDSITVAPAMTLTDREYQRLRDAARGVMREIGVETGGSNVQFAVDPKTGRVLVIEMNPRVSRSSALASKATGYPIAKIAAKLAVGFTLDELENDITGTSAAFEPTIDYVIVKWPRFAFEKFPGADAAPRHADEERRRGDDHRPHVPRGAAEGRALARDRQGRLRQLVRSHRLPELEVLAGCSAAIWRTTRRLWPRPSRPCRRRVGDELWAALEKAVRVPTAERLFYVGDALRHGISTERLNELTGIDPWFLAQLERIVKQEQKIKDAPSLDADLLRESKRLGFSDVQIARAARPAAGRDLRSCATSSACAPVFARVDTCAAEFPAKTPYLYSTYETESEADVSDKKKVIILGGGPNRIGQGIEFDYCCCHAVFALRELGLETIMVNCNPETVSTDYDTSDRLYFEPLTLEDVLAICREEASKGELLGRDRAVRRADAAEARVPLEKAGIKLLGTTRRRHRSRRGSRALRRAAHQARA